MMLREPPALGSKNPRDLLSLAREASRAAGLSRAEVHEVVRMFTMSVADLLDDYFEHDALKGSIASTGVVGVWAGPNTPGTAYNLLHHALGELNGIEGAWGHVIGGMGAISEAIAASARAAGAEIRTDAEVTSIDVRGERVVGVTLASGEEIRAPIVAWLELRPFRSANTGFSDRLSPGNIAALANSSEIAFRAEFPGSSTRPSGPMYWRGVVMWRCDGMEWRAP